jgi:hypothetical protein
MSVLQRQRVKVRLFQNWQYVVPWSTVVTVFLKLTLVDACVLRWSLAYIKRYELLVRPRYLLLYFTRGRRARISEWRVG